MDSKVKLTKSKETDLMERLGGVFKDVFEHSRALYEYLSELPEPEKLIAFELILSKFGHSETKKSGKRYSVTGLSEEAQDRLKQGLAELIDGHFRYILAKRPTINELAEYLFKVIFALEDDEEKIFSIGWILLDKMIPYRQIPQGGVRLSEQSFDAILGQSLPKVRMIESIMNYPKITLTESLSLCLGVILDETTPEEQAVLMTALYTKIKSDVEKK